MSTANAIPPMDSQCIVLLKSWIVARIQPLIESTRIWNEPATFEIWPDYTLKLKWIEKTVEPFTGCGNRWYVVSFEAVAPSFGHPIIQHDILDSDNQSYCQVWKYSYKFKWVFQLLWNSTFSQWIFWRRKNRVKIYSPNCSTSQKKLLFKVNNNKMIFWLYRSLQMILIQTIAGTAVTHVKVE